MRAMILAAGLGTRLRPLTEACPKPLLPLMLQPMLGHLLDQLRGYGIRDIAINMHHHASQLQQWLGDGSRWGVRLHLSYESEILGTAGGIKQVETFLRNGPFLVINGDVLVDLDFRAVWEWHCQHEALVTMVVRPAPNARQYAPVLVDAQGHVLQINGHPQLRTTSPSRETIFTGIQVISPQVLERIPQGRFSSTTADVYPALVTDKAVRGYSHSGYWMDIGVPTRYLQAHWDLLDGCLGDQWHTRLPAGSQAFLTDRRNRQDVSQAVIIPPVVLGRDIQLAPGACVGPYAVLSPRCRVGADAEIRESIVWEGAHIAPQAKIIRSILGKNVYIPAGNMVNGVVRIR